MLFTFERFFRCKVKKKCFFFFFPFFYLVLFFQPNSHTEQSEALEQLENVSSEATMEEGVISGTGLGGIVALIPVSSLREHACCCVVSSQSETEQSSRSVSLSEDSLLFGIFQMLHVTRDKSN